MDNHDYKLKGLIEYPAENFSRGHCTAEMEYDSQ